MYITTFIPLWGTVERGAFDVLVGVGGNAFQAYGFFPLELGLYAAFAATGLALAGRSGSRWRSDRSMLLLCVASFVLVSLGVILGPAGGSVASQGTVAARPAGMSFLGIGLTGVMLWGAWQSVRVSAGAEARE